MQRLYRELSPKQKEALRDVCAYARKHLQGIRRRSGEDYATHGIEVASVLRESNHDVSILKVAVLHDVLVHPDGKELLRMSPLSASERQLVEQMHELRRLHIDSNTEDLDTVLDAFMESEILLPLRMAHRVNDVRHLARFSAGLQKEIATETLHMYTAIAGRLGMNIWRTEMENICFQKLHPQNAKRLLAKFTAARKLDDACLRTTQSYMAKKLQKQGISCYFEHRIKSLYSSYRKMVLKNRAFEELTDRLALRIIVPTEMDCYKTLAVVHASMHPIPGKLKDYIGAPKENGYQSIHTVVYPLPGVTEQPIEIQIRTAEMHKRCEYGALAHGEYKAVIYSLNSQPTRVNLFRNLESLRQESRNPQQFEEALRQYFREDHIALFDIQNNLYHIKKPASALDFVCHVYPDRLSTLKEITVNGRKRSPDALLHDGDIVQAIFGRKRTLQKDWLLACMHPSAKKYIRGLLQK